MLNMLTWPKRTSDTEVMLQLGFKRRASRRLASAANLSELAFGEQGILDRLDLPDEVAKRLMELGFVPGNAVEPARSAPGGEPRVYRVDGSEIAIRRETAKHLILRTKKIA